MGGDKAMVELDGRPLITYPLAALREVCDRVAVVAKAGTALPSLAGKAEIWREAEREQHPLNGVRHALEVAAGRPILVLAVDLPLVDAATLRLILDADPGTALVTAPRVGGWLQPLCARYGAEALAPLHGFDPDARAIDVVESLGVCEVTLPDEEVLMNVNRPEDLLHAASALRARRDRPR
jgi:molybdopterin-guanine dinucleotide biosynthesis protein A